MNEEKKTVGASQKKEGLKRKLRFGTVAMISTVVVVVVVLLLNMVMDTVESRYPITLDLTSDGTFSLSEESLKLASGIQTDTEIVVFVSEKLFTANDYSSYDSIAQMKQMFVSYYGSSYGQQMYAEYLESFEVVLGQFYNMLKEYRVRSNGKIKYEFIDLDAAPALAAGYEKYDVESGTVLFRCGERYQTLNLQELLDGSVDDTGYVMTFNSEVERLVAANLNLVSAPNAKKATVLTGHEEDSALISQLKDLLVVNGCDVVSLNVTASTLPDDDTDVFVIAAPSTDYSDAEVQKLMGWLDNNSKREKDLLVFTNPVYSLPNLYNMLKDNYGIEVTAQLICETDSENQYNMGINRVYADVSETDYTKMLVGKRVLMPMANALVLHNTDDSDKSDVFSKALVTSGETAKLASMDAIRETVENGGGLDDLTIQSLMKDAESYPIVSAAFTTDRHWKNEDETYYTTDVLVIGSSNFLYSDVLGLPSACNEDLFLNVFRGLTGLETTISISSRTLEADTLDFEGSTLPKVLGNLFVWILPLGLIAFSVFVFVRRRRL
ncbi:MAG: GldG family protein [Clostridia bacterium]|nr:GldG family protein [Clostridia bacterium]